MTAAEKARAEAERRYPQIWRFGMNYAFVTERQSAFEAGAEWQASREGEWTKLAAINDVLTTQVQAAQATIAQALVRISKTPTDGMVGLREILSRTDTSALASVKAEALREAAQTFHDRLPDGTGNGRAYNSYRVAEMLRDRATSIEGAQS